MACLRRAALEGCRGAIWCGEKGCKFGYVAFGDPPKPAEEASSGDCLLQLRLRAGDAEDAYTAELEEENRRLARFIRSKLDEVLEEPVNRQLWEGYHSVEPAPGVCPNCRNVHCDGECQEWRDVHDRLYRDFGKD